MYPVVEALALAIRQQRLPMTALRTPDATQKQQMHAAMELLRKGAMTEALTLARNLAQAVPGNIDIRQLLAVCLARTGRVADAEQEFRRALELVPAHPGVLANLATLLRSDGRPREAIALWRQATASNPRSLQAWIDLGATELSVGEHGHAIKAFEKAIALQPSATAWHYLGNARRATGELPLSETAFRNALAIDPGSASAWINLGAVLRLLGRAEEAIACYERAEALGYRGPELRDALAGALTDAGRIADAMNQARRLVSEQPSFTQGHRTLAGLLWEYGPTLGTPEDPFQAFEKAADEQSSNPAMQQGYVAFLIDAGKTDEALDRLEHLRRQDDSPQLVRMHADALGSAGQHEKAGSLYAQLYREGERGASFLNAHVRNLLVSGHWKQASDLATEVVQSHPWNQQALANLGTAWRLLGDSREFWLCDYDRLVHTVDVETPSEFDSRDEFLEVLDTTLDALHRAAREPISQSLRGGSQTPGQLFGRPNAVIESTRRLMQRTTEQWLAQLSSDPEHPFLQRNTGRIDFSGSWSVKLWNAGRHVNHIHSQGWISSAFYVKVPPSVQMASGPINAGCIQFGQPPLDMGLRLEPRRILRPEPGKLVLFPSYLWHGTVPFDDVDPRVTVAFDLVPAGAVL